MNFNAIRKIVGRIVFVDGFFIFLPAIISFIYKEPFINWFSFMLVGFISIIIGFLFQLKTKKIKVGVKEGICSVSLSWIIISLISALPLVINGSIPHYIDAVFEVVSGYTTTGATILADIEILPKSVLFYRSLTHYVGGMGVLMFVIATSLDNNDSSLDLVKAESPGPQVSKLTSKLRNSNLMLYLIYVILTLLEFILLLLSKDPNMGVFESICLSMSTAGTGGFGLLNSSIASYTIYVQYVLGIFMVLFGVNFTLYFLLLTKRFKDIPKCKEVFVYISIILICSIACSIANISTYSTYEESFRHSFLQISSLISTTGFVSTNYDIWHPLCHALMVMVMIIGACGGSTGGGLKVSRLMILAKSSKRQLQESTSPNKISSLELDDKKVHEKIVKETLNYFFIYIVLLVVCTIVVSIDSGQSFITNFTASISCLNNVGPGLGGIGSNGSFAIFTYFDKIIFSLAMLIGRLEIFPILILLNPNTWEKY